MFGATPICPRCSKVVYAAEQVMGPGRKLYHKPCLACMQCNKRLDSYTLLEHNEQPYCKSCHLKSFGIPNLRHANLPTSPIGGSPAPYRKRSTSPTPLKPDDYGSPELQVKDQLTLDDITALSTPSPSTTANPNCNSIASSTTNIGRPGVGTIPRTVPLRHATSRSVDITSNAHFSKFNAIPSFPTSPSVEQLSVYSQPRSPSVSPILPSFATGTRYGIALMGGVHSHSTGGKNVSQEKMGLGLTPTLTGSSPRKAQWGATTPGCGRCGKNVYFAEQVKAIGKTYHKTCLRCLDCGTSLDSHKLRDHDGQLYCVRCYQKAYGPQGNGYALLGKAGG